MKSEKVPKGFVVFGNLCIYESENRPLTYFAKFMIEYNLGVRTKEVYEVKTIDKSFFED